MSKKYNIDELLTESFENFSPEAPDVWQGVQQGIQAAQASSAAGSAMVAAKGSALVVKIIAVVAVAAAVVVGYVLYTPTDAGSRTSSTAAPQQEELPVSPSDIPEAVELKLDEVLAAIPVPETTKKQVSPKAPAVKSVNKEESTPVAESSTSQVVETKKEEVLPKQTNTEVVAENKPTSSQPKPIVTEKTQKQPITDAMTPPVINPNPEEVVVEEPIIPGSFSPDGDGLNDVFQIVIENEQFFLLTIYDEKGKMVFQSINKETKWDGKDFRNGNPCLPGTYRWTFRYQYKGAENEKNKIGLLKLF